MNEKPKVLLIQNTLQRYRTPIYKIMARKFDLTLAYTTKNDIDDVNLKCIQLPSYKVGGFVIHKRLHSILNQYDVVISQPHLSCIKLCLLQWLPRRFKLITWGIGVHASYEAPFNLSKEPTLADWITEIISDGADACIFYMEETIDYWSKYKQINRAKYFEAHNTVEVAEFGKLPEFRSRNSFLFVGTLYAQKGIGELIEAYRIAKNKCKQLPVLNIVGKGPEKEYIEGIIKESGLNEDVVLRGAIYDEEILKDYFLHALLCISPKQAGLSVQKSFGYGTPFVTRPDAITGGERLDIRNGENGIYYNTTEELASILVDSVKAPQKIEKMSLNARDYYLNYCTPEVMAQGAIDAIQYALEH